MSAAGEPDEILPTPEVEAETPWFETECGRVSATAPTDPDVYWRLEWYEHDQRQQTTGGRTKTSAIKKAGTIVKRLDAGSVANSQKRLSVALEEYIRFIKANHQPNTYQKSEPDLRRALEPLLRLRCETLDRSRLRTACNLSPTQSAASHRRSRLRSFISWGYGEDYFCEAQTHALDKYTWIAPAGAVIRPKRDFQPPTTGESERFVTEDQVPSHDRIALLGDELGERLGWGKLAVEFTCATGIRIGEMYAADAPSVDLEDKEVGINWQILALSGLATRKARPKGRRRRRTNFSDVTLTGYKLYEELATRLDQVKFEHAKGTNPKKLLFPAPRGDWWWNNSFTNNYFTPAAQAAGWDRLTWLDETGKERGLGVHTMHSLRHRFARDRIDTWDHTISELQVVGGWKSAQVVWERYYGLTGDLLARSSAKMRRPMP